MQPSDGNNRIAHPGAALRRLVLLFAFVALFLAGAALLHTPAAHAAGTVTDCATYGAVGTAGTLADALAGGGAVTFACNGTIVVPEIAITQDTVLDGTTHTVTLSGNNANRIFNVAAGGSLTLRNITLTGGNVTDNGGAILNHGTLTITASTLAGNRGVVGSAIYSTGALSVANSTVSGNADSSPDQVSGAIVIASGTGSLESVTVYANLWEAQPFGTTGVAFAEGASGSVRNSILADGSPATDLRCTANTAVPLTRNLLENTEGWAAGSGCDISQGGNITGAVPNLGPLADNGGPTQNHLPNAGSPVLDAGDTTLAVDQRGIARPQGAADDIGAVEVAPTCVANPTVSTEAELNAAILCFNAISAPGNYTITLSQNILLTASTTTINNATPGVALTIDGGGFTVDGQDILGVRPFSVAASTTVAINDITVTGGNVGAGEQGGGILNQGNLTLRRCTISDNRAVTGGGGLRSASGSLIVSACTINGNVTDVNGGGISNGEGSILLVTNSTVSGNSAGSRGGGVHHSGSTGLATIESSTIAGNQSVQEGGGVVMAFLGRMELRNTVVGDNSAPDCFDALGGPLDGGNNLIESASTGCTDVFVPASGNIIGVDPALGPLANNGGPTQTHLPQAGSPAIDNGDTTLAVDQRGIARPQGAADDIGAVEVEQYALTVIKDGNGSGTVTSSPAGISCGADCSESYTAGTLVTLTATPDAGSGPGSFTGAGCGGSGSCIVTMSAARNVTVTFTLQTFALNVAKDGTGSGTVTSTPAAINCGSDCSEVLNFGSVITLTATADTGSTFTGWSGAGCSGTGTCVVTVDAAKSVTATFTLQSFALTVAKAGTGSGTVTSSPAGIDCGADCSESYNAGAVVTLIATPSTGSTFTGWSGAGCSGTGACVVTMDAAKSVTATFTLQSFALTVAKAGTGSGTVTSSPAGISCGADCSESYNAGAVVTLTATPATGSTFAGWSGAGCSGTGTCVVTMDAAKNVTATFTLVPPGGNALTIGYWKEHASCRQSRRKQAPVLDQTLAKAAILTIGAKSGPGIVVSATSGAWATFGPAYHLALFGSTATPNTAPDCSWAANLLDKTTRDGKKKMSSDPAFNLAAQLIAAQLNLTAGAYSNADVINIVNQAVLILGKYKFDGLKHDRISSADAAKMNKLARMLDNYNNNCPLGTTAAVAGLEEEMVIQVFLPAISN